MAAAFKAPNSRMAVNWPAQDGSDPNSSGLCLTPTRGPHRPFNFLVHRSMGRLKQRHLFSSCSVHQLMEVGVIISTTKTLGFFSTNLINKYTV
jgi:hypothetical protein